MLKCLQDCAPKILWWWIFFFFSRRQNISTSPGSKGIRMTLWSISSRWRQTHPNRVQTPGSGLCYGYRLLSLGAWFLDTSEWGKGAVRACSAGQIEGISTHHGCDIGSESRSGIALSPIHIHHGDMCHIFSVKTEGEEWTHRFRNVSTIVKHSPPKWVSLLSCLQGSSMK